MHEYIPNSVVIWYDSIRSEDGIIEYQNALTQKNFQFYSNTDGFFTNYWWNEALLEATKSLKGKDNKKLYIGNDCFGRNTYGGGKYDIFKATN